MNPTVLNSSESLTNQRESFVQAAILKALDPSRMVPLGQLQAKFGAGFTEAVAGEVNRVAEAFNSKPSDDRLRIYGDLTSRSGDCIKQGFDELVKDLGLQYFGTEFSQSLLRTYFLYHAVCPIEGEGQIVKKIDLIAAS